MLPNFLIIGAQKAGTSWLAARLRQHPAIFVHPREIHFFDKRSNYSRGIGWYEEQFARADDCPAVGEKTPDYLWANGQGVEGHLPEVHRNIRRALPDVRLLISLRDPVERAISAANHILGTGRVPPHLGLDDLLIGSQRHLLEAHGVLDYGNYADQIRAFLDLFEREQLLILIFEEDVRREPAEALRKACRHLGVDPAFPFRDLDRRENPSARSRARILVNHHAPLLRRWTAPLDWIFPVRRAVPAASTIASLRRRYAEPNQKLFELLGRDVPRSWGAA